MTPRRFSKGEAVRFGWATVKRHLGFFILMYITYGVVIYVPNLIIRLVRPTAAIQWVFLLAMQILVAILALVAALGFIRVALKFCDNEKAKISDLFGASFSQVLSLSVASIVAGIVTVVGYVLLVIPGIIWSTRLSLYPYFIVDKRLGPIAALKSSWALTKDSTWNLLLFGFLLGLITVLGALAMLVGLLAAIPTTAVAHAFVYRKLLAEPPTAPSPSPA